MTLTAGVRKPNACCFMVKMIKCFFSFMTVPNGATKKDRAVAMLVAEPTLRPIFGGASPNTGEVDQGPTESLYRIDCKFRIGGIGRLLNAMVSYTVVVYKQKDGGLFVYNTGPLTENVKEQLAKLGEVKNVIASPNKFHGLFSPMWRRAYPEATHWFAAGHERLTEPALEQLGGTVAVLDEGNPVLPIDEMQQVFIKGDGDVGETIFFHEGSKLLIVSDLCYDYKTMASSCLFGFVVKYVFCASCRGSPIYRKWLVTNREAMRESLLRVRALDFQHLIMCHSGTAEEVQPQMDAKQFLWDYTWRRNVASTCPGCLGYVC